MSMMEPFLPGHGGTGEPGDDVPAADAGAGAPPPSEGFGVTGEEPDTTAAEPGGDVVAELDRRGRSDPPFRTPDPGSPGSPG